MRKTKREWGRENRKLVENVRKTHGDKPGVATQVAALINSRNDTLSDPRIVEELEGIMDGASRGGR